MNNREAAYKHFMQEEMRIGKSYQDIFNAGYQAALASQAQQTESQAARLQAAIEGECNGLAVDLQTAQRILNYVSLPPAPEGGDK